LKRFLKSKLILALVILIVIVAIFAVPLARNSHAQASQSQSVQTVTVQFPVLQQDWNTGIDLPGGQVTFAASGVAAVAFGEGTGLPSGDPGCVALNQPPDAIFPMPGMICNALVGKVGVNGAYFFIGSGGTFSLPAGRLYLDVNQYTHRYDDPNGYWTVSVTFTTPTPSPTVSFTKAATPTVTAGGTVDYTLTLKNTGTLQLHDIHLSDLLPPGLDAITAVPTITFAPPTGSGFGSCTKSGLNVSCTVDNFAPGAVVTIKFSAKVDSKATGTITNTASAQSFTLGKMTATARTFITPPPDFGEPHEPSSGELKGGPRLPTGNAVLAILCGLDILTIGFGGELVESAGHIFRIVRVVKALRVVSHAVTVTTTFIAIVEDVRTGRLLRVGLDIALAFVPFASCFELIGPPTLHALRLVINPPQAF
jgi:uncharacterized repeat protein (TIGR01451 family)